MTDRPEERRVTELRREARYRLERLQLYKARVYAGRTVDDGRLRKLQRASDDAAERLRRAEERAEPLPEDAGQSTAATAAAPPDDYAAPMGSRDDDEDWTGTPPEGRHARERAKPEYWRTQRPPAIAAAGIGIAVLVLVLVLLLG